MKKCASAFVLLLLAGCHFYTDTPLFDFAKEQARAIQHEDTPYIDLGIPLGRPYLVRGWSIDERDNYGRTFVWAIEPRAEVAFGVIEPQDLEVILNCRWLDSSRQKQLVRCDVNGNDVGAPIELKPEFTKYQVFVPVRFLKAGQNVLGLSFAVTEVPPNDSRTLASCFDSILIAPYNLQEREVKMARAEEPQYLNELRKAGRDFIVQRVPGERIFALRIPENARLTFECGFAPEDRPEVEGAGFRVTLQSGGDSSILLYDQFIDPRRRRSHHKLFDSSIDLKKWVGQDVKIIFSVTAGYEKLAYPTYALWIEPRLSDRKYFWNR